MTVYDNFTSGRRWHLQPFESDSRLDVVVGDVEDLASLAGAVEGSDTVIHLASNPDIARAATEPAVDFDQGTVLTHHVVEAVRMNGGGRILYASGSGVYGDVGNLEAPEDYGPLVPSRPTAPPSWPARPSSPPTASCSGSRAVRSALATSSARTRPTAWGSTSPGACVDDPTHLRILGDGMQSKSYVHVHDVIDAVLLAAVRAPLPFAVYNVATGDYPTVRDIATLAGEVLGIEPGTTTWEFTGGDRGWKGDVPVVRLDSRRIRALGWENKRSSLEALRASLESMMVDAASGRFDEKS